MTVLVGIIDHEKQEAWLASDSMLSEGYHTPPVEVIKLFDYDFMAISVCGSWRGANIIEAHLVPPTPIPGEDMYLYCIEKLVPALIEIMKSHKHLVTYYEGDVNMGMGLLIAVDGKLFSIDADFCVVEFSDYTCDGAGREYAYGALHAVGEDIPIEDRLSKAILAASAFDKTCGHSVVSVKKGKLNWVGVTHEGEVVQKEQATKKPVAKKKKPPAKKRQKTKKKTGLWVK
jgi:hypothetical protein